MSHPYKAMGKAMTKGERYTDHGTKLCSCIAFKNITQVEVELECEDYSLLGCDVMYFYSYYRYFGGNRYLCTQSQEVFSKVKVETEVSFQTYIRGVFKR